LRAANDQGPEESWGSAKKGGRGLCPDRQNKQNEEGGEGGGKVAEVKGKPL